MTALLLRLRGIFNKPAGVAPAFDPATLFANGEIGIWYDPSDLTTMWTDTAGTIQATVGDPVARIDDKSGNGRHATQATLANRPILRQSGSLYYLEFDGAGDSLTTSNVNNSFGEIGVTVGVEVTTGNTSRDRMVFFQPSGFKGHFSMYFHSGNSDYNWQAKNQDATMRLVDTGAVSLPNTSVITGQSDFAIPDMNIYMDGNLEETQSFGATGAFSRTSFYSFGNSLSGKLYQLIHLNRVYAGSEQADTESYVAAKAGITI